MPESDCECARCHRSEKQYSGLGWAVIRKGGYDWFCDECLEQILTHWLEYGPEV